MDSRGSQNARSTKPGFGRAFAYLALVKLIGCLATHVTLGLAGPARARFHHCSSSRTKCLTPCSTGGCYMGAFARTRRGSPLAFPCDRSVPFLRFVFSDFPFQPVAQKKKEKKKELPPLLSVCLLVSTKRFLLTWTSHRLATFWVRIDAEKF